MPLKVAMWVLWGSVTRWRWVTWLISNVIVRVFFFFQAEDGIRDYKVTGVQTCALPISERDGRKYRVAVAGHRGVLPSRNLAIHRQRSQSARTRVREAGAYGVTPSRREIGRASCRERV